MGGVIPRINDKKALISQTSVKISQSHFNLSMFKGYPCLGPYLLIHYFSHPFLQNTGRCIY